MARGRVAPHQFWDDARSERLRKLWGTISKSLLAERMGCSKSALEKQARKLNLPPLDTATMRHRGI